MIRKSLILIAVMSSCLFALTYPYVPSATNTLIDTVFVPVRVMSHSVNGTTHTFWGKVMYGIRVGKNDSLNIDLSFAPVGGTGPVPTVTSVNGVSGSSFKVGFLGSNGMNGENEIKFTCTIAGTPAQFYTAKITVTAILSSISNSTDSLIEIMKMTSQELADQCHGTGTNRDSPNNSRLFLPGYYMSNATQGPNTHGSVCCCTNFPAPSGMACSFDTAIINAVGRCVAREYWAKGKYFIEGPVAGLVYDPREGRAAESWSEDPYLCGKMSAHYILGGQSLLQNCIIKHYICNNNETMRKTSNSVVSERMLRELYGYAFEIAIREGKALGVMSAYPKVNGVWNCDYPYTLTDMLKYDWGHKGFVVSDWSSLHSTTTAAKAGQDIELRFNNYFGMPLVTGVTNGSVSLARLKDMARRIMICKFFSKQVGPFVYKSTNTTGITPQYTPWLMSRAHRDTSLIISRKSLVLAKNDNSTLPLAPTAKIFVTGTYANQVRLGVTGSPEPSPDPSFASVSPLKGITAAATRKGGSVVASQALADVVVVVVGVAGEDEGSDRPLLSISPTTDNALVTSAKTAGKKVVTIFTGGSAATKEAWYTDAGAVVVGFYPGEEQGIAIAELLYGDINPSGKLSCSFPETESDLWLFQPTATTVRYPGADTGVGYRWYEKTGKKMFLPFGHGLSYTTYSYGQITVTPSNPHIYDDIEVSVPITNTGDRDGDEIAQLYISDLSPVANHPRCVKDLRGFARVNIPKKTAKTVTFKLKMREFAYYNTDKKKFMVHPGQYKIMVGPSSINLPVLATKTITLAD